MKREHIQRLYWNSCVEKTEGFGCSESDVGREGESQKSEQLHFRDSTKFEMEQKVVGVQNVNETR